MLAILDGKDSRYGRQSISDPALERALLVVGLRDMSRVRDDSKLQPQLIRAFFVFVIVFIGGFTSSCLVCRQRDGARRLLRSRAARCCRFGWLATPGSI